MSSTSPPHVGSILASKEGKGVQGVKMKKTLCTLLSCAVLFGCFSSASAAEAAPRTTDLEDLPYYVVELSERDVKHSVSRATGSVDITLAARELAAAGSSFQMDYNQVVTIKCSYSPASASVDFGLVDSSNKFHYVSGSNGSVDQSIRVSSRGQYTFAIRNNSGRSVTVNGRITY